MADAPNRIDLFDGGNDAQRIHLNQMVDAINDHERQISALEKDVQRGQFVFDCFENGTWSKFQITALRVE